MKCIVITSAYPPQTCGAGDYTQKLITSSPQEWHLYHSTNWSLISVLRHIKAINKYGANNINLQYPTVGYGWSIVPHILCIYYSLFTKKQFSVTLHELSQLTRKSKIAANLFLIFSNKLIFTNEFEQAYAVKKWKKVSKKSVVIGIYTNIMASQSIKTPQQRKYDLVNFGIFRQDKGIDEFIDTVIELRKIKPEVQCLLMGKVLPAQIDYYNKIRARCQENSITLLIDKSEEEVSEVLNDSKIAYLPFPDGASQRRGSFLAALYNGAVVASTIGIFTTEHIKKAIIPIENPEDTSKTAQIICNAISAPELLDKQQRISKKYLEEDVPLSWKHVTDLYTSFLEHNC